MDVPGLRLSEPRREVLVVQIMAVEEDEVEVFIAIRELLKSFASKFTSGGVQLVVSQVRPLQLYAWTQQMLQGILMPPLINR